MTLWGQVPMAQLYDLTKVVQCGLLPENTCRIPYQKQCKSNFNKIPTIPGWCEVAAICDIANNSVHTRLDYESNPYTASFLKRMLQYCCVHCQVWIQQTPQSMQLGWGWLQLLWKFLHLIISFKNSCIQPCQLTIRNSYASTSRTGKTHSYGEELTDLCSYHVHFPAAWGSWMTGGVPLSSSTSVSLLAGIQSP